MKQSHQKHTQLARPDIGLFHKNEWAFTGASCSFIQTFSQRLIQRLSANYEIGYADAAHGNSDPTPAAPFFYTDKINHRQVASTAEWNTFQLRVQAQHLDGMFINGNHFEAKQQVVFIHPGKRDSLRRKLDRLTDVAAFILTEGQSEIYPFLKNNIENYGDIPIYKSEDFDTIVTFFENEFLKNKPVLNGLVLAGGKSTRMGRDKGLLDYHGKPQRDHTAELIQPFCEEVYLSCRPAQVADIQSDLPLLPDTFTGLGPFGAILSAFREKPRVAWLVVACDLPLLDRDAIRHLVDQRNTSKLATAFYNEATDFPEPLITIWEQRAYPVVLQFLAQGYSCPRKVLINTNIELVQTANSAMLKNVNTPDEMTAIQRQI